jgi:Raf kinase inhibitor-like YbhB/YbcL family protein
MLEKLPAALGRALSSLRAGTKRLTSLAFASAPCTLRVTSSDFEYAHSLPASCTADGAGVSPPLEWSGMPAETKSLVLIVEDVDSPTPAPFVHAIALDLPLDRSFLLEGELSEPKGTSTLHLGKSSALDARYLPPDPPHGHGEHLYYFQLFALDASLELDGAPGRTAVIEAMRDHVLAKGVLVGCYGRP